MGKPEVRDETEIRAVACRGHVMGENDALRSR